MLDRDVFLKAIAHRGLHDARKGIIENTAAAFEAAIRSGYGIECDLRPASGGLPVVFHDETLERLVEGKGVIGELSVPALKGLRYRDADDRILLFSELLELVAGREPLLVEIKSEWELPDLEFLRQIVISAMDYRGPIALMSFDPDVLAVCRELDPDLPRGIISGSYEGDGWWSGRLSSARRARLRDLREAGDVAPHFFAYQVDALPTEATVQRRAAGLPVFTWTVRTPRQRAIAEDWADAMIFEGFLP